MSDTTIGGLAEAGVLEVNDGYRTKRPELGKPGVPILRVAEVLDGRISPTFGDHIREEFRPMFRRKSSMCGDVVVTTKGTVGRVARIAAGAPEFVYSPQVCYFRVHDPDVLDAGWLYQWLRGPEFRLQVQTVQDQTDMAAYINLVDLRATRINLPPLAEQRAIAYVLGALDDKIEANRRTQEVAEGLARAQVGKAQGECGSVVSIGSLVERVSDIIQPGDIPDEGVYVGLEHMPQGSILLKEHGMPAGLASAKARFRPRDVLFGKLRPYFKKVATAPVEGICSTDILVLRPKLDDWAVAAAVCASDEVVEYASAGSDGTRMPRVSWDYLSKFEVPMPEPEARRALQAQVSPLLELGISLTVESDQLAALRDALLPKLLSGELRVRDAETLVGEAV